MILVVAIYGTCLYLLFWLFYGGLHSTITECEAESKEKELNGEYEKEHKKKSEAAPNL